MRWFKVYINAVLGEENNHANKENLANCSEAELGFFIKILALAGRLESSGNLSIGGVALERKQIFKILKINDDFGNLYLKKLIELDILTEDPENSKIVVKNWSNYQDEYERKKKLLYSNEQKRRKSSQDDVYGQSIRTKYPEQNRIEKNRKEENRIENKNPLTTSGEDRFKTLTQKERAIKELFENSFKKFTGHDYIHDNNVDITAEIKAIKKLSENSLDYLQELFIIGWSNSLDKVKQSCLTLSGVCENLNLLKLKHVSRITKPSGKGLPTKKEGVVAGNTEVEFGAD